jgi:hypothetical protein
LQKEHLERPRLLIQALILTQELENPPEGIRLERGRITVRLIKRHRPSKKCWRPQHPGRLVLTWATAEGIDLQPMWLLAEAGDHAVSQRDAGVALRRETVQFAALLVRLEVKLGGSSGSNLIPRRLRELRPCFESVCCVFFRPRSMGVPVFGSTKTTARVRRI